MVLFAVDWLFFCDQGLWACRMLYCACTLVTSQTWNIYHGENLHLSLNICSGWWRRLWQWTLKIFQQRLWNFTVSVCSIDRTYSVPCKHIFRCKSDNFNWLWLKGLLKCFLMQQAGKKCLYSKTLLVCGLRCGVFSGRPVQIRKDAKLANLRSISPGSRIQIVASTMTKLKSILRKILSEQTLAKHNVPSHWRHHQGKASQLQSFSERSAVRLIFSESSQDPIIHGH